MARRAGSQQARSATATGSPATVAKVEGSVAVTPNSSPDINARQRKRRDDAERDTGEREREPVADDETPNVVRLRTERQANRPITVRSMTSRSDVCVITSVMP